MAVLVNLETFAAIDAHVVLAVNAHQRHLAQHVKHGARACLGIGLHIVTQSVVQRLDQLSHRHHLHVLERYSVTDAKRDTILFFCYLPNRFLGQHIGGRHHDRYHHHDNSRHFHLLVFD